MCDNSAYMELYALECAWLVVNCQKISNFIKIIKISKKILIFGSLLLVFFINETNTGIRIVSWASALPIPILESLAGSNRYQYWYYYYYRYCPILDGKKGTFG